MKCVGCDCVKPWPGAEVGADVQLELHPPRDMTGMALCPARRWAGGSSKQAADFSKVTES